MSAKYFLFWLKGYLASLEVEQETPSKDDIELIKSALEMAIKSTLQGD